MKVEKVDKDTGEDGAVTRQETVVVQSWPKRFSQQFLALLWKNLLLAWRNWRATLLRLSSPFVFMILVWLIDKALQADERNLSRYKVVRDPIAEAVTNIPRCEDDLYIGGDCYDFFYTVDVLDNSTDLGAAEFTVNSIVDRIRDNNEPKIPDTKVQLFPGRVEVDDWLLENPEQCLGAVHFYVSRELKKIDFTLQTNSSVKFFKNTFQHPNFFAQVPLQMAVEREVARQHLLNAGKQGQAENLEWNVGYKEYPHPAFETLSVVGAILGPFIFAANMFGFVGQISTMVSEKQDGMNQALRTMGMLDSAYWMSWGVWELFMSLLTSLFICVFGWIFQFGFFLDNNFGLVFCLFFIFQLAMSSMGMVLSVFLSKSVQATIFGFVIFLVGWIMQVVLQFGIPYSSEYYNKYMAVTVIFSIFPWNPFFKGVTDLSKATSNEELGGLAWSERSSYCRDEMDSETCEDAAAVPGIYIDCECKLSLADIYGLVFGLYVLYFTLAIYLEKVLPNENGVRLAPWYFLLPRYWGFGKAQGAIPPLKVKNYQEAVINTPDDDVEEEAAKMKARVDGQSHIPHSQGDAVEVFGLQKNFGKFWAIKGSWFNIEQNQLFCLLGPNGAGKTTTVNCLTGVFPVSGGDALVYGESIDAPGGMESIRSMMGVCPQFDVLWKELSGREHLQIFGIIKGLDRKSVRAEAEALLEKVKLTGAGKQRAGTYSGGMKRRLSVAIALLGNPRVVYLDEPTTGMDPISRRYVWDIIESAKAGRAIVLTTHSMEEADILGDRICIMARGRIRAIGSSIRLKQKFGAGYEVSVSVGATNGNRSTQNLQTVQPYVDEVKELFRSGLGLNPKEENRAYITYLIPRQRENQLPAFLSRLESERDRLRITDIQLSLTTLEEVFLKIARDAEIEGLRQSGITHTVVKMTDGSQLAVELGLDAFIVPNWDVTYRIQWGQDETGRLMITDAIPDGAVPEGAPEPNLADQNGISLTSVTPPVPPPLQTHHNATLPPPTS